MVPPPPLVTPPRGTSLILEACSPAVLTGELNAGHGAIPVQLAPTVLATGTNRYVTSCTYNRCVTCTDNTYATMAAARISTAEGGTLLARKTTLGSEMGTTTTFYDYISGRRSHVTSGGAEEGDHDRAPREKVLTARRTDGRKTSCLCRLLLVVGGIEVAKLGTRSGEIRREYSFY